MRTRSMAAMLGGAAMLFALLPAAASAEAGGERVPSGVATGPIASPTAGPAPDRRPSAPVTPANERRAVDPTVAPAAESRPTVDPASVVVTFRDDVVRPNSVEGEPVREVPESPYAVVEVPEGRTAEEVAADIATRADVESAEPNAVVRAFESPGQTGEFGRIGIQDAWTRAKGSSDVIVAVVDSGIDQDHPDFSGRLVSGFDFVDPGTYPHDSDGHGTQVAGVIGARQDAGTDIDGIAGAGARIMPLRVLNGGSGLLSDVAAAIRFAADNGASIVNLSLGAEGRSTTVDNAVAYAIDRGLVVIASAGNEGAFFSVSPSNAPGAIGVSATDDAGNTASFTSFGPDVDLAAPGVGIDTTADGGGTSTVNGTSFSTPMVAGVAALLKQRNPGWSGGRIVTELLLTAEDRGPTGVDDYYGYGLVDAAAALGVSGRSPFVGVEPAAADAEPNDVSARATPAGANNTGSINPEGDVDWWQFSSTVPEDVTITVTPAGTSSGPRLDTVLQVFRPDGSMVANVDTVGIGPEVATITTAGNGTHRISVSNYHGTISPNGYELSVARSPATGPATGAVGGPPWLESTTPEARARNVSRTANLQVVSGRSLQSSSVDTRSVVLLDGIYGTPVSASVRLGGGRNIDVDPAAPLLPGRPYLLVLAGVRDAGNNPMPWTTVPFSTSGSFEQPVVNGTYRPVVGDFSGDGADDIIYYAPGSTPDFLYLGEWSGLFRVGPFPVNGTYQPFTLDLDGNGHDDIIWYAPGTAPDFIWYFDERGPTNYRSVPTRAVGTYKPFTLDLNGDGYDDIIWYAPGTAADYIWYGKAGGGHTSVPTRANGVYDPFVGDFDNDGFDDIFWYAKGSPPDFVWYGEANGYTSVGTQVLGSYEPVSGDFDGDGFGDVLFYAPGPAADYQWLFGPSGFDSVRVTIDGRFDPLGGDFNGDRFDDVFLYGPGSRSDQMLLGGRNGIFG